MKCLILLAHMLALFLMSLTQTAIMTITDTGCWAQNVRTHDCALKIIKSFILNEQDQKLSEKLWV